MAKISNKKPFPVLRWLLLLALVAFVCIVVVYGYFGDTIRGQVGAMSEESAGSYDYSATDTMSQQQSSRAAKTSPAARAANASYVEDFVSAKGLNAVNKANVGSVVGSRIGGDSKNVTVSGAVIQSAKGLNAVNKASVGSVVGSRIGGDSKNVTVSGAVIQSAKGLNAKNSASVGSVVGSRIGSDSKNVTVSGAVIQSAKGLNATNDATVAGIKQPPSSTTKPETGLPPFPWPPETPSSRIEIPRKGLLSPGKNLSISEVQSLLSDTLWAAGYLERSYYSVPGGFALVTRIEGITDVGKPLGETLRYLVSDAEKPFSLPNYILELFVAPKGKYRFLVFIVSDEAIKLSVKELSEEAAIDRLNKGAVSFPSKHFNDSNFTDDHDITVLIYEYELSEAKSQPKLASPGIGSGLHLLNSGISSALNTHVYGAEILR